jgi:photosystem II stability/assembly factor-like uncharacterized protein
VAVGGAGTILTYSDSSFSWIPRTSGTTQPLYAQSSYGSQRVVVGGNGVILTSTNGTTWTTRTSGTSQALYGIARNGNRFVAVGAAGTVLTGSAAVSYVIIADDPPIVMLP